jgi:predicted nuclease of predicted toxin-antitoxin system
MAIAGLSIRLYLDHNADPDIARDVRRDGYDAIWASEVGNERLQDEQQLRWATEHGRAILTHDIRDFRILDAEWAARGESHAGIILAETPPELSLGELIRRLRRLLETMSADEMVDQVIIFDHLVGVRIGLTPPWSRQYGDRSTDQTAGADRADGAPAHREERRYARG